MNVAVVVPALNEEASIVKVVEELIGEGIPPRNIFVVDNGSVDQTVPLVKEKFNNQVTVIQAKEKGKGFACCYGFHALHTAIQRGWVEPVDYVFTLDADYTYPAMAITHIMRDQKGEPALLMVREPLPGAMPWLNMVANRVINWWANKIYTRDGEQKIKDLCSGLWGFRWNEFNSYVRPYLKGGKFTIEADYYCTLRRLGWYIKQFSYSYRPRAGGEKKTKPMDAFHIMRFIYNHKQRPLTHPSIGELVRSQRRR